MEEETKIINTPDLLDILSEYYSIKERRDIIVQEALDVSYGDININCVVNFYCDIPVNGKLERVYLTEKDLMEALSTYMDNQGYTLDKFKYMGTVRRMGFHTEKDIPIFEGVMLFYTNKKDKKRVRS